MFTGILISVLSGAYLYPMLIDHFLPLPLFVRGLLTIGLVTPIGFFLGMPFPWGLKQVGQISQQAIPRMWGINGGATVLGSVFAIFIAMTTNFTTVFLIAAAGYVFAAFIALTRRQRI